MEWVDRNWYGMGRDLPCLFLSDAFIISLPCTNWLKTIWMELFQALLWMHSDPELWRDAWWRMCQVQCQSCAGWGGWCREAACAGHCWVEAPVLSSPQRVFPSYTAAPSVEQRSPAGRESAVLSPPQRSQHSDLQWHQWACQQCDY